MPQGSTRSASTKKFASLVPGGFGISDARLCTVYELAAKVWLVARQNPAMRNIFRILRIIKGIVNSRCKLIVRVLCVKQRSDAERNQWAAACACFTRVRLA